jgi:glycosyltransferase involved in cell wall biosynthesis
MDEMPAVNAMADLVVIPSLMEAVSLSALEAMASGKPVIATEVGGLPEIIKDEVTGLLVPPRDPTALADAIVRLHSDYSLRNSLASQGRALAVERYSWDFIAKKTLTFYRGLLEARA